MEVQPQDIGRSDCGLKLSDLRTANLVELLRDIVANHEECYACCPPLKRAADFLVKYDHYKAEEFISSAQLDWMDQHGRS